MTASTDTKASEAVPVDDDRAVEPQELRARMENNDSMAIYLGSARTGIRYRKEDKLVARFHHRRFLQALAEGIISGLDDGAPARLVRAINGIGASPALGSRELGRKRRQLEELNAEIAEMEEALAGANTDIVRKLVGKELAKARKRSSELAETIAVSEASAHPPRPFDVVEVAEMLAKLADLAPSGPGRNDLEKLILDLRPTHVNDLHVAFEVSVALPEPGGEVVVVGPMPFSVENMRRLPIETRSAAMVDMIFEHAWPISTVAQGIPLISVARRGDLLAAAASAKLKPLVGSKAATMIARCDAPEVLAVISRHLELGNPDIDAPAALESRIVETYLERPPPGPKAWLQAREDSMLAALVHRVEAEGSVAVPGKGHKARMWFRYWETGGHLKREGDRFVKQVCHCGAEDLAFLPTPEVAGLVCLSCREDRKGLHIPESWNVAVSRRQYWEEKGFDLGVPAIPGMPVRKLDIEPLSLRPRRKDVGTFSVTRP